jgi:hypothetical protein
MGIGADAIGALSVDVLAVLFPEARDVPWCSLSKTQGRLSSIGKLEAKSPSIRPGDGDEVLGLLPRHTIGLPANHTVDALPINHDVDREDTIACRVTPERDAE